MLKGVARLFRSFTAVLLLLAAFGSFTQAATHRVSIRDGSFDPAVTNIIVGDTIQWVHEGSFFHTTTSKTGKWDSSILLPGEAFDYTFTEPGRFEYHSTINTNMSGTVIVQSGLSIEIVSPAPNARFTPGESVTVQVALADPTNSVTELQLSIAYNGSTTVMTNATNNFTFVVEDLQEGFYTFTASAIGSGTTRSSSPVTIRVGDVVDPTPEAPRIISIAPTNNNNVVIRVSTTSTAQHEILASSSVGTNAVWTEIGRATPTNGTFDFVDTTANANVRRFYRIRVVGGGGNPGTAPTISGFQREANGAFTLTITSGRTGPHTIQASSTLAPGSWTTIHTAPVTGGTLTYTDNEAATLPRRFYRVGAQ